MDVTSSTPSTAQLSTPSATKHAAVTAASDEKLIDPHSELQDPGPIEMDLSIDDIMKSTDKRIPTDSDLSLALFDFGGQSVFNVVHHLFITPLGMYAIVFNMELWIDSSSEECSNSEKYTRFWLNSIIVSGGL
jgi:hypothetical protein